MIKRSTRFMEEMNEKLLEVNYKKLGVDICYYLILCFNNDS